MSRLQKPYAAFGATVLVFEVEAGAVINDNDVKNGIFTVQPDGTYSNTGDKFVWMVFEGHMRHTNLNTGEVTDRTAGYSSLGIFDQPGRIQVEAIKTSKILCMTPELRNEITLDSLSNWSLKAGDSTILPIGTKLLLAHGQINIDGSVFSGTKQIRVSSNEKVAIAVTDSYGLLFT
jgi:hypothetical protein